MDPKKEYRNSIWRYSLRGDQLSGRPGSGARQSDLINIVMINLGQEEEGNGLLWFLEVLFSDEKGAEEKREILEQEYGIEMSRETEGRVEYMCNLSQGVLEKGIERDIAQGMKAGHTKGIAEGRLEIQRETARTLKEMGMSEENIAKAVNTDLAQVRAWLSETSKPEQL